jgi:uncharacterized membrane protein (UPF0136 family)
MWRIATGWRPLSSALFVGVSFAALSLVLELSDQPAKIAAGSAAMALLAGVVRYREEKGRTMLPTWALVLMSLGSLALYAVWMLRQPPAGGEWIAAVVVLAFFLGPLALAYRQWRTGR